MKKLLLLLAVAMVAFSTSAQNNEVKRIPGVGIDPDQAQYTTYGRGFWFATEAMVGVSCHLKGHNMGFTEADVTAGYRFSQYLKVGVGIGARYYIKQECLRRSDIKWGMPLFATVRGNLMPDRYRTVVPYYQIEVGGSVRDGMMIRPGLGIRIGEPRQAFTLGLNYMGQEIATRNAKGEKCTKYTNFVALRLGYEF